VSRYTTREIVVKKQDGTCNVVWVIPSIMKALVQKKIAKANVVVLHAFDVVESKSLKKLIEQVNAGDRDKHVLVEIDALERHDCLYSLVA
jgi:hypothetical protein